MLAEKEPTVIYCLANPQCYTFVVIHTSKNVGPRFLSERIENEIGTIPFFSFTVFNHKFQINTNVRERVRSLDK